MREDKKSVRKYLYLLLSDLNNSFKVNPEYKLNESEIFDTVIKISKDYYFYKLHDFAIFVENAKSGRYGKSYNRLDIPTIYEWLVKYDTIRSALSADHNLSMKVSDQYERESPKQRLNLDKMKKAFKTSSIAALNEENEKLKEIDKF